MEQSLPTGTVTFLFTDIEGSTRLVQDLDEGAWVAVLESHNDLLRNAIRANNGRVVKTEGDAFFAVFVSAADAATAAADAQRALAGHDWPGGLELKVRMGIHTGAGSLGGDDYVGLDVHRAARIAGCAHGGQVVMSEPTAVLAERELTAGLSLRDLGKHRLKDLSQPETLFELQIDGLAAGFPPLRTLDVVPNNLPLQVTSFVGRTADLARALSLFASSRVLTITGAGGTGKTRLALELGAELGAEFRDGVYFADLAPVTDVDVVPSQILGSLGLQASAGAKPPRQALLEQLEGRQVLMILDNFEQIIGAAPLVAEMVRRSPQSKFIVTSRGPLRITAEQEMPLEPLPLPTDSDLETVLSVDAVSLFLDRALAVRPDFALTPDTAPAVAELVRRLDGLPLAIELVASRVRLLPVAAILDRLDPGALGSGAVDLPERQRTIQGAIAWSHDLLDPDVQRLFSRLGVFAGGAALAEIERVCGPDGGDVLEGLGDLLDQSLLRRSGGTDDPRFRMLHVIREYAQQALAESGESDEIHRRHLVAYTELAESLAPHLLGANRKEWLDRFGADHDNVRVALDWAVEREEPDLALRLAAASWRFWQSRGHLHEAQRRLHGALAVPGGDPARRAKALEALGGVRWWQGEIEDCLVAYREALEIQRHWGEPAEVANAIYNVALATSAIHHDRSELEEAAAEVFALFDEAEALYRQIGDVGGLGDVAWGRGNAISYLRDYHPDALEQMKLSIEYYREAGNEFGTGWGMFEVAHFARKVGDADTSWRYLKDGLSLFAEHRDISAGVMFIALAAALNKDGGDEVGAARLAGAYHALRIASGTDLVDHEINRVEGLEYEAMEALEGRQAEAYREGCSLDFDEAVAYTLECAADDAAG